MTGREVLRILRRRGCEVVRQHGSHVRVRCGDCQTTVPVHAGEDVALGTLRAIARELEPCIGKGWLSKA
ncbi:MAG: type II toxin-antitoxin system HicA family toxin [Actinomycetota bacterium]